MHFTKVKRTILVLILVCVFLAYASKWFIVTNTTTRLQKMLPLLSTDKFSYKGINLFQNQNSQCLCNTENKNIIVYNLKEFSRKEGGEALRLRRKREHEHFTKRQKSQSILLASPNSPLGYPSCGVQVTLEASLGTIDTRVKDTTGITISGRGKNVFVISTTDQNFLNYVLQHITYTSVVYDIDTQDIVTFTMDNHVAHIPVSIRQPPMAHLYDSGADRTINSLVTITTKTFLRYDKLRVLISSIRMYYPEIKIIVADDNNVTEKIEDKNVEQYFMPYGKGWFAGRNLAVSQVTTKYFLWVDDDYFFTKDTKIEKLLDVLESTNLDLVGGNVEGNHFSFTLTVQDGDEEGDCLHWKPGSYRSLQGFPKCVLTGGVVNFFLAQTDRALSVGFDPKLQRVAHTEFFVDALGHLRIGSCSDVSIGHQKKGKIEGEPDHERAIKYNYFRTNTQEQVDMKLRLHYFKNRLGCFTKY
ncbi:hypothetical protein GDO86_014333 [Hymenochirus boettgeri]|uniref:Glycosyltransferase 2-like domain-containing protein n=1 Tax=Hymenochirus boettgeri TaxID=247094 RepID=A0A8T2JTD0_9PIPI|nr:hypothetical protein GDO86_014333 [Hymenochirus boettgeri]